MHSRTLASILCLLLFFACRPSSRQPNQPALPENVRSARLSESVLTVTAAYSSLPLDTNINGAVIDIWRLAKAYPDAGTLRLTLLFVGNDKYGNTTETPSDPPIVVDTLAELRRYQTPEAVLSSRDLLPLSWAIQDQYSRHLGIGQPGH